MKPNLEILCELSLRAAGQHDESALNQDRQGDWFGPGADREKCRRNAQNHRDMATVIRDAVNQCRLGNL